MFLQGNLQAVFDALYNLGIIDPVLEMDWVEEMDRLGEHYDDLQRAVEVVNRCQADPGDLVANLGQFSDKVLNYLAMEVAREFADYHAREQIH